MRSHTDIDKGINVELMKNALTYYQGLADTAVKNSHVIDIFACNLDQVGLLEMKVCPQKTGGVVILADSFKQSNFKESFPRVFQRYPDDGSVAAADSGQLKMAFNAKIEMRTSREFKVQGAIGPCSSTGRKAKCVSDNAIGEGHTDQWTCGGLNPSTTLAFYFEVTNPHTNRLAPGKRHHIQIITTYQHSSGSHRMRVTTLGGPWHSDPENLLPVSVSFDQEAAAVLMARLAVRQLEDGEEQNVILRWIDRSLIRLTSRFAEYRKEDPSSLRLTRHFSIYPQFMFHLRRSVFIQIFNSSPDETAYFRFLLNMENVTNGLVMIQPALLSYSFNGPPEPVLLDAVSIKPDVILLLDTFFQVVVMHGETIAAWREAGYHEQEQYANLKSLLAAPKEDAMMIMETRFPVPRYIPCDGGSSQARFVYAKLNPSVTHNTMESAAHKVVFSDDVSLKVFMEHLCKLAVQT